MRAPAVFIAKNQSDRRRVKLVRPRITPTSHGRNAFSTMGLNVCGRVRVLSCDALNGCSGVRLTTLAGVAPPRPECGQARLWSLPLSGQPHDGDGERILIDGNHRGMGPGRTCLTEPPAGPAFEDAKLLLKCLTQVAPLGAQKVPRAASCWMSLSNARSTTALHTRWFARSNSLSRLAWSSF